MKYSSADRANIAYHLAFGLNLDDPLLIQDCPTFCEISTRHFLRKSPLANKFKNDTDLFNWFDSVYPLDPSLNFPD